MLGEHLHVRPFTCVLMDTVQCCQIARSATVLYVNTNRKALIFHGVVALSCQTSVLTPLCPSSLKRAKEVIFGDLELSRFHTGSLILTASRHRHYTAKQKRFSRHKSKSADGGRESLGPVGGVFNSVSGSWQVCHSIKILKASKFRKNTQTVFRI